MKEHTKIMIMAMVENIVIEICFTTLAVVFNHWWIVLFSLLLLNSPKYVKEEEK